MEAAARLFLRIGPLGFRLPRSQRDANVGVIRPHGRFSVPELWRNNEKALHDWLLMEGAVIAWRDDPSNQSFRFTISSCRPLGVVSDDPSGRRL